MTQNKFWLVCEIEKNDLHKDTIAIQGQFDNVDNAKDNARKSAINTNYEYVVFEATHHFKANVDVIETSFEATPEESLPVAGQETPTDFDKRCTPKHEFKVGDKVKHKDDDWDTGVISKINIKCDAFIEWEKSSGKHWYPLCDVVHA